MGMDQIGLNVVVVLKDNLLILILGHPFVKHSVVFGLKGKWDVKVNVGPLFTNY